MKISIILVLVACAVLLGCGRKADLHEHTIEISTSYEPHEFDPRVLFQGQEYIGNGKDKIPIDLEAAHYLCHAKIGEHQQDALGRSYMLDSTSLDGVSPPLPDDFKAPCAAVEKDFRAIVAIIDKEEQAREDAERQAQEKRDLELIRRSTARKGQPPFCGIDSRYPHAAPCAPRDAEVKR